MKISKFKNKTETNRKRMSETLFSVKEIIKQQIKWNIMNRAIEDKWRKLDIENN